MYGEHNQVLSPTYYSFMRCHQILFRVFFNALSWKDMKRISSSVNCSKKDAEILFIQGFKVFLLLENAPGTDTNGTVGRSAVLLEVI